MCIILQKNTHYLSAGLMPYILSTNFRMFLILNSDDYGWTGFFIGNALTFSTIVVDYDSIGICPFCNSRIDEFNFCACGGNMGVD